MTDEESLFGRLRERAAERLAPSQDGDPSPQARDEEPVVIGRREFTEEPDRDEIETYVTEYKNNPLLRVPIQNFAADVLEPGVSVSVAPGDEEVPNVRGDHPNDQLAGEPLDDALQRWLSSCYIDGVDFDADTADLLEAVVKDRRGRRGTALVEHVYDDPRERERLLGLRPFRVETTTAYTREGKRILLRGGDSRGEFDTVALNNHSDYDRSEAPQTPAGRTAALAQFDSVFGAEDRDEVPFALEDVSISAYDADTGRLFGRPDTASVAARAKAVRRKLQHVDQSVLNAAFGNIIAKVETQNEEIAKKVRDNLDVNVQDPGDDTQPTSRDSVSVTNAPVELTEVEGQVPDVVDVVQQEIEFVLAGMPTPLYRVGFAGDINRDISAEQSEDYRDAVKRERRRVEADFRKPVRQKARELLYGSPHSDEALDVDVELRIRPESAESPLRDEEFDANEFESVMSALSTAAGPKGGATAIVPREEIISTFLDMDPEAVLGSDSAPPASETDPAVQEAFAEFTGLANRYQEGDIVETPDRGVGVVAGTITENKQAPDDSDLPDIEASPDSPTHVVVTEDSAERGIGLYKAGDLQSTEIETDVDPLDSAAAMAALAPADSEIAELDFQMPESWRESETPARLIALKTFASMGGSFDGCVREMRGEVRSPERFCGSFLDEVLGYKAWRGDSPLPGD